MDRFSEPWIEQNPRTKNWFVRWREKNPDGTIIRKSRKCDSKEDAKDAKDLKREELKRARLNTHDPHGALEPIFQSYMREMEAVRNLRPGALRAKRTALLPFLEHFKVKGDVTREKLKDYRDDLLETELSPVTVAIRMREVKAFVRWMATESHLQANPWVSIELPSSEPVPRFLSNGELSKLEATATGTLRAIIRMAYLTGMRRMELLTAKWEDVSWVNRRAFVTVWSTTSKNRRSRTIALRKEVLELLGKPGAGPLFPDLDSNKLRWAWDVLKEEAGFKDRIRFHDLRHTFCKLYLQGGGTIADLMQITGHQSIVMMQIYSHFEVKYKADRMDAIYLPDLMHGSEGRLKDNPSGFDVIPGDKGIHPNTPDRSEDDDNSASSGAVLA